MKIVENQNTIPISKTPEDIAVVAKTANSSAFSILINYWAWDNSKYMVQHFQWMTIDNCISIHSESCRDSFPTRKEAIQYYLAMGFDVQCFNLTAYNKDNERAEFFRWLIEVNSDVKL